MTPEPKRRGAPPPAGRENREHSGTLCTATKRNGEPCTNFARRGMGRCRMHGGSAPQVIAAAQVRLLMAADRLMAQLLMIAEDKSEPTPVRLAAIRDALDRAGLNERHKIEIEAKVETWEHKIDAAVVDWGELGAYLAPGTDLGDPNIIPAVVVEDEAAEREWDRRLEAPRDAPRRTRPTEMERQLDVLPRKAPNADDPLPPWVSPEAGSQTATRRADEHRKAVFAAEKASKGLAPLTRRPRR